MKREFTLRDLGERVGAEVRGDSSCRIQRLNTLRDASEGDLAFLASKAYRRYLADTRASAVILSPTDADVFGGNALVADNPYLAYARLSVLFDDGYRVTPGVHDSAIVAPSARLGEGVAVGAQAVIGEGVEIGASAHIGAGTVIGDDCTIGPGCFLHANVTLYHGVSLGRNSIVHSGAVVGSDGFGFAPEQGRWVKIRQLGGVEVGANVEIGAGSTIDRGALGNTVIGDGVILDNLVQIAHNVQVGDNSALAGCAAIAGSTIVGRNCVLAGGAGLVGHIELCDNVTVTAMSMITRSITRPGVYSSGTPFDDNTRWKKNAIRFNQLDRLARQIASLRNHNESGS